MPQTPVTNAQASLGLTEFINRVGAFPPRGGGGDTAAFLGSIEIFAGSSNFFGNLTGQVVPIQQNTALFSLLGTNFGGNGTTNFALPNLDGVELVGTGTGPNGQYRVVGETFGTSTNTLTRSQLPTALGGNNSPINNDQPSLAITYVINPNGVFPSSGGALLLDSIGVISAFAGNFEPGDDLICDGRLLPISQYQSLFAVIGTIYGGDGQTTFALPNLQGRDIVGAGSGFTLGQQVGSDTVTLTGTNLPGGGNVPINNQQPGLVLNYYMATNGIFPSQGQSGLPDTSTPVLGEIIAFAGNINPNGWVNCDGRVLSISQNQALFAIIGTTYGGNGTTTFAVPDLRGRTVLGTGSTTALGQVVSANTTTLLATNIPPPASPTIALTSDTGSSSSDKITSNGALTTSGLLAGSTVQYSTDSGTTWTSSFNPTQGTNTVLVRQTDTVGNSSAPSTALTFTYDNLAPTAAFSTVPNSFNGTGTTTFSGTVADSGSGIANVKIYNGTAIPANLLGTATVAAGVWSLSLTLASGSYANLTVVATDIAGNITTTAAPFVLVTGIQNQAYTSLENNFDSNGKLITQQYFTNTGALYLAASISSQNGSTTYDYKGGTFFTGLAYDEIKYTYDAGNVLVSQSQLLNGILYIANTVTTQNGQTTYAYKGGTYFTGQNFDELRYTYDASNALVGQTQLVNGVIYIAGTVTSQNGNTTYDYKGGNYFTGQVFDELKYSFNASNAPTSQTQLINGVVYITGTISVQGGNTTYDFKGGTFFNGKAYDEIKYVYDATNKMTGQTELLNGVIYLSDVVTTQGANTIHDFTGGTYFNGQTFNEFKYVYDSTSTLSQSIFNYNDGSHLITGYQNGLTLSSIFNDTMTGGGSSETFVLQAGFGHDAITDLSQHLTGAGHDTVQFSTAQFANFGAMLLATTDGANGAIITASNGDQLTLYNVTKAMVTANSGDFSFI